MSKPRWLSKRKYSSTNLKFSCKNVSGLFHISDSLYSLITHKIKGLMCPKQVLGIVEEGKYFLLRFLGLAYVKAVNN